MLTDSFLQEQMGATNKVLDASAATVGKQWKHYLWTVNKELIPETVEWMKSIGVETREMRELPIWQEGFQEIF